MANRHLSRQVALQSLFEWDFRGQKREEVSDIIDRNILEGGIDSCDKGFISTLFNGILGVQTDIDNIIIKAAPDWPLDKISAVDRNILRMGLYELVFGNRDEVPAKVAINEAIELAKTFGGENSGRFVNGVLGSVYKELGEPGKDAEPRKKKPRIPDIPYEEMPIIKLGGAIVYARDKDETYLALVHDVFGHWTLSKGKIDPKEDVQDGTVRKIKEELGIDITIEAPLGSNEYIASDPNEGKLRKQVNYFLARANFDTLTLGTTGGLDDARWFKLTDILELNFYNDILPIITKAITILSNPNEH